MTIGLAALIDAGRRFVHDRVSWSVGALGAVVLVITLYGVVTGPVRENYLTSPADAGKIVEQLSVAPPSGYVWVTSGIGTPRWVSYYLATPVWTLESDLLGVLAPGDLVLVRTDRVPGYFPEGALEDPLLSEGRYRLIRGEVLAR